MEKKYTAPEVPHIVEPERMAPKIPKIPKWIKKPLLYSTILTLFFNSLDFLMVRRLRDRGISKSEIEEILEEKYSDDNNLYEFVMYDLSKPGRELAYLVFGDGEQEK